MLVWMIEEIPSPEVSLCCISVSGHGAAEEILLGFITLNRWGLVYWHQCNQWLQVWAILGPVSHSASLHWTDLVSHPSRMAWLVNTSRWRRCALLQAFSDLEPTRLIYYLQNYNPGFMILGYFCYFPIHW